MIIPPVFGIGGISVVSSGVASQEHIVFRPTEPMNLAQCGILLTFQHENGVVTPIRDNLFWFGDLEVAPPCSVVVYTGKGEYRNHQKNNHPIHVFYWGKEATLFTVRELVPVLFRIAGISVGGHLTPPPRIADLGLSPPLIGSSSASHKPSDDDPAHCNEVGQS
jgi:hypothetical protein